MIDSIVFNLKRLIKKPLRVGMIAINYFGKYKSDGVAVHVYRLSRELAELGCEVHIFTKGEKNQVKQKYIGNGKVVVHEIKISNRYASTDIETQKRMIYALFDIAIVSEIMKEHFVEKLDVIHTHNVGSGGAFISKYFNNIPWVHTFHSLEKIRLDMLTNKQNKYYGVAKWMESSIKYADAHIAVSESLKNEVVNHYDVLDSNVRVIPNAVNRDIFYKRENVNREKCIGYVGRFSLEKGINKIPEIIEKVFEKNEEVCFEILAPIAIVPDALREVENKLNNLVAKYPSRITWHREAISREALADFYSKCMSLIQPSKYEGFGMTVLEAMACGCVPIVSNCGGLPEVVGNTGKVIVGRASNFSKEVLKLSEDYRLRERYSKRAMERSQLFDWKDVGLKTLNLYRELISENKKAIEDMKVPKVSVIIPVYNAEKFVEEAIKSVLDQSYQSFELIVVNDASTDKTKKIINRLAENNKKIIVINNKKNLGKAASVNRAFEIARGDYLAFLDADDLFTPERIKKQVAFLDRNKKVDFVYGDFQKILPDGEIEFRKSIDFANASEPLEKLKKVVGSDEKFEWACRIWDEKDYIPACSVMFRRKIIDNGITMDPEQRGEDYDFWFQIVGAGYRIKKMPRITTYAWRLHPDQKTKDVKLTSLSDQQVINKAKSGGYIL